MVNIFVHWNHLLVDGKKMSKSAKNFYRLSDITEKGFSPLAFRLLTLQAHYSSELNFTWESLEASQNRLLDLRAQADIRFQGETIDNSAANKATIESLASDLDTPNLLAQPKLDSEIIGLKLLESSDITAAQKALIAKRQAARDSKDFAESDKLRDQLLADNLEIDDTPNGPRWRRTKV
jgi:cysteinyl-tRNA synthetase